MKLYAFILFAGIFLLNSVSAQEPKEQDIYEQDLMRDDKDPDGSMKKEDEKEPDGSLYLNSINSGGPHPVNIENAHAQGRRYYTCHYCICSHPRGSHGMSYTSSCYRCYGRSRKWQRCYYCSCSRQYNNYYSYFGFCYSCY